MFCMTSKGRPHERRIAHEKRIAAPSSGGEKGGITEMLEIDKCRGLGSCGDGSREGGVRAHAQDHQYTVKTMANSR